MTEEILASIQVRRDSQANWEAVNPVLLDGEAAYEQDTDMFKIGDGIKRYSDLPYHNKVGPQGLQGVSGVYVGSGDMPEGYNVQIDPDGTPDLAAETWTFTLEDGTTVTKVVVLQ